MLKEAVAWNAKEKRGSSDMKVVWRKTAEFHLKGISSQIPILYSTMFKLEFKCCQNVTIICISRLLIR